MPLPIYQVDAFCSKPFAGNPAAVCFLEDDSKPSDDWMQSVAAEMNLSETAFLFKREPTLFDLRWFTPASEVDLCGHATLAAAHVIWKTERCRAEDAIRYATRSGILSTCQVNDQIEMDFPSQPTEPVSAPGGMAAALGVDPVRVERNGTDYLVEVRDEKELLGLRPDLRALCEVDARGVIVTCQANKTNTTEDGRSFDFLSRYFAPAFGIDEDPVTGSAHCCLAPYWQRFLNRSHLVGYQASARGGVVEVEIAGDRVKLRGQAVMVSAGQLLV